MSDFEGTLMGILGQINDNLTKLGNLVMSHVNGIKRENIELKEHINVLNQRQNDVNKRLNILKSNVEDIQVIVGQQICMNNSDGMDNKESTIDCDNNGNNNTCSDNNNDRERDVLAMTLEDGSHDNNGYNNDSNMDDSKHESPSLIRNNNNNKTSIDNDNDSDNDVDLGNNKQSMPSLERETLKDTQLDLINSDHDDQSPTNQKEVISDKMQKQNEMNNDTIEKSLNLNERKKHNENVDSAISGFADAFKLSIDME